MTRIAPMHDHDMTDHFARMNRQAEIDRLTRFIHLMRAVAGGIALGAVLGYLAHAAQATCNALPALVAEAQARNQ